MASSLALMQILLDSGPPLYRLSVANEVGSDPTAASGGVKGEERVAAVKRIKDQRKPADFFGHRNRKTD